MDVKLPDMEWARFLEQFRAEHPKTVVVIATCSETLRSMRQAQQLGIWDCLTLPCSVEELRSTVANGLRHVGEYGRPHLPPG